MVVTSERVLKVVVGIWLLDIFLTALEWITQTKHLRNVHAGVLLFCLVLTLTTHAKIFLIFRRHQRQINSFHVCRRDPLKTAIQRQSILAVNVAYIVAIYVICKLPVFVVMAYLFGGGRFVTCFQLVRDYRFPKLVDKPDTLLLEKQGNSPSNLRYFYWVAVWQSQSENG